MPLPSKKKFQRLELNDPIRARTDVFSAVADDLSGRVPGSEVGCEDNDCFTARSTERSDNDKEAACAGEPVSKPNYAWPEEKIQAYKNRLLEANDAEHNDELQAQIRRLGGTRERLVASGNAIGGLSMTLANGRFRFDLDQNRTLNKSKFLLKSNARVSVFLDMEARSNMDTKSDSKSTDSSPGSDADDEDVQCSESDESHDPDAAPDPDAEEQVHMDELEAPWEPSNPPTTSRAATRLSAVRDRHAELIRQMLLDLKLRRAFDGTIVTKDDRSFIVKSRHNDAARILEDAENGVLPDGSTCPSGKAVRWVVMPALQHTTYSRQSEAAEALLETYSRPQVPPSDNKNTADGNGAAADKPVATAESAAAAAAARVDEKRLRYVLTADPDSPIDAMRARAAAAQCVEWLESPRVRQELETLLSCQDAGLNEGQLAALLTAREQTLTLMQGPPGTGKTHTLAAMGAALCRVFHTPPPGLRDAAHKFDLPTDADMKEWRKEQVGVWIGSFRVPQLPYLKGMALRVTEGFSGEAVASLPSSLLSKLFRKDAEAATAAGGGAAAAMRPDDCAAAFVRLRQETQAAIEQCRRCEGRWDAGYFRTADRDMRIVLCADTNTAANRLLELFVRHLPGAARDFNIVRIGVVQEGEEGSELARQFHIDRKRNQHPLMLAAERLRKAVKHPETEFTADLRRNLRMELERYTEVRLEQAKRAHRPLLRKHGRELVQAVQGDIIGPLDELLSTQLGQKPRAHGGREWKQWMRDLGEVLKPWTRELKRAALYDILIDTQVVVGTHTSIGEARAISEKRGLTFPIVVLDEAGQASEPACMIPLTLGAEWVLVGGDPRQLPPTIKTDTAQQLLGFYTETGGSLYGRLQQLGVRECVLRTQYRMHPAIRDFPSSMFYGGRLQEDPACPPDTRLPTPGFGSYGFSPFPGGYPLAFYDVYYGEEKVDPVRGRSMFNEEEAHLAEALLLAMATDPTVRSIFIVTPYKAQAEYISRRLEGGREFIENQRAGGKFHAVEYGAHTVDGYQGREADVIIISTVRSNDQGFLGHLVDVRRLNVAITRARRGLIFLGNATTLRARPPPAGVRFTGAQHHYNLWPALLEHLGQQRNAVRSSIALNRLPALPNVMGYTNAEQEVDLTVY